MRSIRSSSVIALLFVAVLAVPAGAAQSAAPTYVSSEPSKGEKLHQAPDRVEVTFNEPLDASSDLTVKDSCGRAVDDGDVEVEANTIGVGIKRQPSGHYAVTYVATGIGGITGTTEGSFHFEVHAGAACGKSGDGGGHGNHEDDKDDGGGGGGGKHEGHGSGDGSGGGGSGGGHSSMDDPGSGSGDHSAPTHSAGRGDNSNMRHSDATGRGHKGKHGNKKGKGHGGGHGDGAHGLIDALKKNENDGRTLAAGEGTPFGAPDGTAVMLALGLSLALGVLGGWFLRLSGGR